MKQTFSNILPSFGRYRAGICAVYIAPKQWITNLPEPAFNTGIITTAPTFIDGKDWIVLELTEPSYDYDEKPKTAKAGPYFDVTMEGVINDISPELALTLQTLRYHQFICKLKDKQGRYKIVGNTEEGMEMNYRNQENNKQGGTQEVTITLAMSLPKAAPFYSV